MAKSPAKKAKKKRGPPAWKPTDEQRANVRVWIAMGLSVQRVSEILGVSHVTAYKALKSEIDHGHELELAENMKRLQGAAAAGNVSAMKYLDERIRRKSAERLIAAEPQQDQATGQAPVKSTDKRVGRKEERLDAAKRAIEGTNTDWGSDLKPGLPN